MNFVPVLSSISEVEHGDGVVETLQGSYKESLQGSLQFLFFPKVHFSFKPLISQTLKSELIGVLPFFPLLTMYFALNISCLRVTRTRLFPSLEEEQRRERAKTVLLSFLLWPLVLWLIEAVDKQCPFAYSKFLNAIHQLQKRHFGIFFIMSKLKASFYLDAFFSWIFSGMHVRFFSYTLLHCTLDIFVSPVVLSATCTLVGENRQLCQWLQNSTIHVFIAQCPQDSMNIQDRGQKYDQRNS